MEHKPKNETGFEFMDRAKRNGISPTLQEKGDKHYPGKIQLCSQCGDPTGRCEDDSLYLDEDQKYGPLCENCYNSYDAEWPED